MKAGHYKDYADFCRQTDWMEPDYDEPSESEMFEEWIKAWKSENKTDEENEKVLWEFFDKIVYHDYFDDILIYTDWSLEEIKDKLLEWYIENYDKLITQFMYLIQDVQRINLRNKCEEDEVLKASRILYTKQTRTCI